ncbi:MAG: IS66 family transposase [SAR324 cluster bacterium]|nr:IS66 family transposase [SAR324 cluster bacterium]
MLHGYRGVVQTDGYAGYDFLDLEQAIIHAGCWAHSRRKFHDVLKAMGQKNSINGKPSNAQTALNYIGKIYAIEKNADQAQLTPEQRVIKRVEETLPLLHEFKEWLLDLQEKTPPRGLLGAAVSYTLNQWERLIQFIHHGEVTPDNNWAENSIRPLVLGRKNWLFCDTPAGAKASAAIYSLIETAKANNLEPFAYLKHLFEQLPYAHNSEQLTRLLPQFCQL